MRRTLAKVFRWIACPPLVGVALNVARANEPPPPPAPAGTASAVPPSSSAIQAHDRMPGSVGASSSPYVSPFQLRNVIPRTGARIDTTVAPYDADGTDSLVTIVFVSGQVRLADHLSLQARWGFDDNRGGIGQKNHTGILNPSLGVLFGVPIGLAFRFAVSTSISLPLATGGGDNPDPNALVLQRQGALARSAMDNASFAVNDLGFPTGISVAYIQHGFTAQMDWTLIASSRVKGDQTVTDSTKVNSTYALLVGYFIVPELSFGVELRYQYYLTATEAIVRDASARDNLTLGAGARIDVELSGTTRMRPGVCYARGLHGPVQQDSVNMVQFDIPVSF